MSNDGTPRYGVDLITFFDPAAWGEPDSAALAAHADREPLWFWTGVLDRLEEAGVTVLETTFPPADLITAARAFGGLDGLRTELDRRGMRVVSEYFGDLEHADLAAADIRERLVEAASAAAERLAAVGGSFLVAGMPMRRSNTAGDLEPVDLATLAPIVDDVHAIAEAAARHGVRLLLHPESHSTFWTSRDVDLVMLLADPFLVGLCADTGHLVLGGSDPVAVIERHADRIGLLHWKDAAGRFTEQVPVDAEVFVRHRPYFRPMGEGIVDWPAVAAALDRAGVTGPVLLELDAAPDPVARLVEARRHLDGVFAHHPVTTP
ncbi:sugar phosphate isomerase/epimerase family protein [Curtobacterium sp. USHLN213]|uniref:sugar phosphate isomerase/epimerase family protein n=1 Tax=Curtobacterium sp. USHLN213 TaxID=3081255 RepID=UPI003016F803